MDASNEESQNQSYNACVLDVVFHTSWRNPIAQAPICTIHLSTSTTLQGYNSLFLQTATVQAQVVNVICHHGQAATAHYA